MGLHTNRGAKRARQARAALGLDPGDPLDCLLTVVEQQAGVPVLVYEMRDGLAGAYWRKGDDHLIHLNGAQHVVRQRFTLAHELGHHWCAHAGTSVDDEGTLYGGSGLDSREVEANAFAAEFLVPRVAVEELCADHEPALEEVALIAGTFGVSAFVVLYRLGTCRVAGDAAFDALRTAIEAGEHLALDVDGPRPHDLLASLRMPYSSPALDGSEAAAALRGDTALERRS